MREIFLVQDSRPLYTYPEVDLFAPAKVKPSQDAVAADGDTATAATSYDDEDEEEGNEENQEEGDVGECRSVYPLATIIVSAEILLLPTGSNLDRFSHYTSSISFIYIYCIVLYVL